MGTILTARTATNQAREFLRSNGFNEFMRVAWSKTDHGGFRDDPTVIRTVIYFANADNGDRFDEVATAAREQLAGVRSVHHAYRDDKRAHYRAAIIFRTAEEP